MRAHSLCWSCDQHVKVLFIEPNIPPRCSQPFKEPLAGRKDTTRTMSWVQSSVSPEKYRGDGAGKKQGLDTEQTISQTIKISLLSAHTRPTSWTGFLKTDDKQAGSPQHCLLGSCADASKINQGSTWKPTGLNWVHRSPLFPSQKSYLRKLILQLFHFVATIFP